MTAPLRVIFVAIRYKRVVFGQFVRLFVDPLHITCVRINTAVYVF